LGIDRGITTVGYFPQTLSSHRISGYLCGLRESRVREAYPLRNLAYCLLLICAAMWTPARLAAHHGETNYDTTKMVTVKAATVTTFEFINPHTLIYLDAKSENGEIEKWTCEARSPAMLVRNGGWDKTTLKPGDVITAIGFQAKNGTKILRLKKIVLANGKELPDL
jgi:hypothetical protein